MPDLLYMRPQLDVALVHKAAHLHSVKTSPHHTEVDDEPAVLIHQFAIAFMSFFLCHREVWVCAAKDVPCYIYYRL